MAARGVQLGQETMRCAICLDLLKAPVTVSCGHSYCKNCINFHWDTEDEKTVYSCPQCRKTTMKRPVLMKNTMLADLVEQLKKPGLQAARADHCYAGAEDVACDVCTGRKVKALKSCLVCLASYCEEHLQPHYESLVFKRHTLVGPSKKLQENVCSHHNEVMKRFCRTDQQCICYLCCEDQHRGHDTVSSAAERTQRQKELELSQQKIHQGIQGREKNVKVLEQQVEAVNRSADKAEEDTDKIFKMLIRLLEKRSSDVKQQIRSQQKTELSRNKDLQEKLQREITELKSKDAELQWLLHTENHNHFLLNYRSATLSPPPFSSRTNVILKPFEDVIVAVSKFRGQLQDLLTKPWTDTTFTVTPDDVLLPQPEPKTRAEFLQYSKKITLDPYTVYKHLLLSDGNRKVTAVRKKQSYPSHPHRFKDWPQVLSREILTGRCYWEVECRSTGGDVTVAVTYPRKVCEDGTSDEMGFEVQNGCWVINIDLTTARLGVYVDQSAGIISFYNVSDNMTLFHRVQTTFTQPLYAGIGIFYYSELFSFYGASAEFCKLK
ncbi:tripartite motif-containing protein 16-like [Solea solea]|uniref:tripartite motif-containing protein 16-like n=1 Tax=Solea solea TaxID=90069 RepID=UPI00272AD518|nr:tripartite motif-containing protein 16-like [Solea solea]